MPAPSTWPVERRARRAGVELDVTEAKGVTGEMAGEDRDRFPAAVWWLGLVLGLVVGGAVLWGVPNEEEDLTARARAALDEAGLGAPAAVSFEGRDARLAGTVAAAAEAAAARALVHDLRGVRTVDAVLTTSTTMTTPSTPTPSTPTPSSTTTPPSTTTLTPSPTSSTPTPSTSKPSTPPPSTTAPPPELPVVRVRFDTNSSDIADEAKAILDLAAVTLAANPALKVVVAGHADSRDTEQHNQGLSDRRAASVVAYLVDRRGVDRSRLKAVGCGERDLDDESRTSKAHAANRRVELVDARVWSKSEGC